MTDTQPNEPVALLPDDFLEYLECLIDEASMDLGAAHQEGGVATDVEKDRVSTLSLVRDEYLKRAYPARAPQASADTAWVSVPREPTEAMLHAAQDALTQKGNG